MLDRTLRRVEDSWTALIFAAVATLALLNVISRYFLGGSLAFTSEITVNLAVWLVMMGTVIGVRENAHLGFGLLHDRATGKVRTVMTVLITAVVIVYFAVFVVFGTELIVHQIELGRATPAVGIPHWLFTLAVPIGGFLGTVRAVQSAAASLRKTRPHESAEAPAEGAQR